MKYSDKATNQPPREEPEVTSKNKTIQKEKENKRVSIAVTENHTNSLGKVNTSLQYQVYLIIIN